MAGGTRSARLTFGSLAIVLALAGCTSRSWQFWKSSSTEAPTTATQTAAPEQPAPASPNVPTARLVLASETPTADPRGHGFVDLPAIADVRFRAGLVTVGKADTATLDGIVRWLQENPAAQIQIEGHTDDLGAPVDNLAVGQKRAASAMRYLISKGVGAERITIVSYGSDRPLCAEKTDACRARNRRVHFLVKQR
jgi:peptidoglycan-associated lipoprotein